MKRKDTKNITKSTKRGSVESKTKISEHEGDIMTIAKKDIVCVPQSLTIQESAELMIKNSFRRLPVTNPGTGKLLGIVTANDILNFLGGGEKSKILEKKYNDNFLAGINESVKEIMTRDVHFLTNKDSIQNAINIMLKHSVGALPVVDSNEQLVGIISERDIVFLLSDLFTDEIVEDCMTKENILTTTPGTPIEGASKIMIRNNIRRVIVMGEDLKTHNQVLSGILTSTDILKFLGDNTVFEKMKSNSAEEVLSDQIDTIMIKNILSTSPETRLGDLCGIMKEKNIGGLPVLKDNKLVGIITERDLLRDINI